MLPATTPPDPKGPGRTGTSGSGSGQLSSGKLGTTHLARKLRTAGSRQRPPGPSGSRIWRGADLVEPGGRGGFPPPRGQRRREAAQRGAAGEQLLARVGRPARPGPGATTGPGPARPGRPLPAPPGPAARPAPHPQPATRARGASRPRPAPRACPADPERAAMPAARLNRCAAPALTSPPWPTRPLCPRAGQDVKPDPGPARGAARRGRARPDRRDPRPLPGSLCWGPPRRAGAGRAGPSSGARGRRQRRGPRAEGSPWRRLRPLRGPPEPAETLAPRSSGPTRGGGNEERRSGAVTSVSDKLSITWAAGQWRRSAVVTRFARKSVG